MGALKLIFYSLILITSTSLGILYGGKYKNRATNLIYLEQCIRFLQSEILYNSTPLPDALFEVSRKGDVGISEVFEIISKDLLKGKSGDVYHSFIAVKDILKDKYYLLKEDIEIFLSLGKVIGRTNKTDQEKSFSFIIDQLKILQNEANNEKIKYEKMYSSLGVLVGIGIIIILI